MGISVIDQDAIGHHNHHEIQRKRSWSNLLQINLISVIEEKGKLMNKKIPLGLVIAIISVIVLGLAAMTFLYFQPFIAGA